MSLCFNSDRARRLLLLLASVSVMMLTATTSRATIAPDEGDIYLDEDFEGASVFVDRNFPVTDTTTTPTAPLVQGINLRAWSASFISPKVQIGTNDGAVVSTRAYAGSKSYQLQSGQALAATPGTFPRRANNGFRLWQFALNTDAATAALPAGTEVGHFQIDYSNDNATDLTPDVTINLRLTVQSEGQVDLVCVNNGANLGSLSGGASDWILVSVLADDAVTTPAFADTTSLWAAHDPLTGRYRGPEAAIPSGILVFAKKNGVTTRTRLTRGANLGASWGNNAGWFKTSEIGWRFEALNAGTIYIDNFYWDCGGHQQETRNFDNEQAARMESVVGLMLPSLFSDNMVLQREANVPVWGIADPGEAISVSFNGQSKNTTAAGDGRWSVTLDPMAAGGPFQMTVTGNSVITFNNVMVGEVWVSSGQSNMAFTVAECNNAAAEIAAANYPKIRLFTPPQLSSDGPRAFTGGTWQVCSPATVGSFSGVCYFFGRDIFTTATPNVPVGLINSSVGATMAELWLSRDALAADPQLAPLLSTVFFGVPAGGLYNGMIAPLQPYAIRGALWYQGESNVSAANLYNRLLNALITDWRARWSRGTFPYLFVQLPNYEPGAGWPELREAQLQTLSTSNTAMAVTIDIGYPDNLHPPNKQDVGPRLGLGARKLAYGQDIPYIGPLYRSAVIEGNRIRLYFDHTEGGLVDKTGGALQGFGIAGADNVFTTTTAVAAIEGNTVVVSSPIVPTPRNVRYAWAPNPPADLFNGAGLPASPFRTNYPGSTPVPTATPGPSPTSGPTATPTPTPTATPTRPPSGAVRWRVYQ